MGTGMVCRISEKYTGSETTTGKTITVRFWLSTRLKKA
jgi:hypothetical protein